MNRKKKAAKKKAAPLRPQRGDLPHRERFDQLLDDAIFGVKKKSRRG